MKLCPKCGRDSAVLVHNVQDGSVFCIGCAPASFSIHGVLTLGDLEFLRQCGIDPELPDVLQALVDAARK